MAFYGRFLVAMHRPWNHPFRGFLSPFCPKYATSLLKSRREIYNKTKTVYKQSFKIKYLSGNVTYPKLKVWILSGPNLSLENPKYCQKPEFFPETTSLWLSNNTSTRSQINHRILIKSIKKIHFWNKNGVFKKQIGL